MPSAVAQDQVPSPRAEGELTQDCASARGPVGNAQARLSIGTQGQAPGIQAEGCASAESQRPSPGASVVQDISSEEDSGGDDAFDP